MTNAMESLDANAGEDSPISPPTGAAILLVIGEPLTEDHKNLILAEINKGFLSWDVEETGIDINDELAQIANRADLGEEGPNVAPFGFPLKEGERVIRHHSDKFHMEILVNPQAQTVTLAVKNFLTTPTKQKHLIYAGHAFQGSGAWILQDDTFTFSNFAHAFKDPDVETAVKQQEGCVLSIYAPAGGDWSTGHINKSSFSKLFNVRLNQDNKLANSHGVLQFTAYVGNFVRLRQLSELLQSSDVVGNIRFSRPTLYIFPGCQGDSALFGISGFNLLVNGGYSRKACFWDFTRHLDRIDATLMTHLGTDNIYGLSSVLKRKSIENVHPEIGYMYLNVSDKLKMPEVEDSKSKPDLMVNLAEEGSQLVEYAKQIGQVPQTCSRSLSSSQVDPINLYHKVGHGSLDMYILNPITDSKELKEFFTQWNQGISQFGTQQHVPLPNVLSVCALLVWRPANPQDNITRIFFPGNAPQHKVIEGLEKLKNLDILKHPKCTNGDLAAKPATKKPPRPVTSRPKATPPPYTKPEVKKAEKPEVKKAEKTEVTKVEAKPTRSRPMSAPKAKKEDVNKKTSKGVEKMDKSKSSSSSSSPSKASTKSLTPTTPKEVVPPPSEPVPVAAEPQEKPAESVPTLPSPLVPEVPLMNGDDGSSVDAQPPADIMQPQPAVSATPDILVGSESPTPLPDPVPEQAQPSGVMDKQKLLELGIYEEDQDLDDGNSGLPDQPPQMFGGMQDSYHEGMQGSYHEGMQGSYNEGMQGSFHEDMQGSFHEGMQGGHVDGMQGSMYVDRKDYSNLGIYDDDSGQGNALTPEDEPDEEIRPQALPEPQAYAPSSYSQEPDLIPNKAEFKERDLFGQEVTSSQEPDMLPVHKEPMSLSPSGDEQSTAPVEDEKSLIEEHEEPLSVDELQKDEVVEQVTEAEQGANLEAEQIQEDVQEKEETEDTEKSVSPYDDMEPQKNLLTESVEKGETVEQYEESMKQDVSDTEIEKTEIDTGAEVTASEPTKEEPVQQENAFEQTDVRDVSPAAQEEEEEGFEEQESDEEETSQVSVESSGQEEPVQENKDSMLDRASPSVSPLPTDERMSPEPMKAEVPVQQDVEEETLDYQGQSESPEPLTATDQTEDSFAGPPQITTDERMSPEPMKDEVPVQQDVEEEPVEYQRQSESPEPPTSAVQTEDSFAGPPQITTDERMSPEPIKDEVPVQQDVEEEPVEYQRQSESPEPPMSAVKTEDSFAGPPQITTDERMSPEPIKDEVPVQQDVEEEPVEYQRQSESPEPPTSAVQTEDSFARATQERYSESPETDFQREVKEDSPLANDQKDTTENEMPSGQDPWQHPEAPLEQNVAEQSREESPATESEEVDPCDSEEDQEDTVDSENEREQYQPHSRDETPESDSEACQQVQGQDYRDSLEREACQPEVEEDRSSPYDEEDPSDQKFLLQDSLSEDQRQPSFGTDKQVPEIADVTDSGAAGPYDSLGMDTHPSDLLTPESEATDPSHSHGLQMDYQPMDEQDEDADSVEDVDEHEDEEAIHRPAAPREVEGFGKPADVPDFACQPQQPAGNPFDMGGQQGYNPFLGMDQQQPLQPQNTNPFNDDSSPEEERGPNGFNPLAEWGEPMGLPSPPPPAETKGASDKVAKKSPRAATKLPSKATTDVKKPEPKKPAASTAATAKAKPLASSTPKSPKTSNGAPKASNGVPEKSKSRLSSAPASRPASSRLSTGGEKTSNTSRLSIGGEKTSNTSRLSTGGDKKPAPRTRPATAPTRTPPSKIDLKPKTNGATTAKRTTTGSRASPTTSKMPPLPPFTPFYVDLTYIPAHGNTNYSDVDFFKRVRARYYVLSSLFPNPQVLNNLLEAKKTWENKDLQVTVIPTYDNDKLRSWMNLYKDQLVDQKVEIAPSASRCTIQLQDHETSCSAYRLEF